MIEKDLKEYIIQERRLKRLIAEYKDLGANMCMPKSPNLSALPGGGDGEEKLALIMDKRTKLMAKIEACRVLRDIAEKKLDTVSDNLDNELQISVFDMLYRKGYEPADIAVKLKYCKVHIYRQRNAILNIAAKL